MYVKPQKVNILSHKFVDTVMCSTQQQLNQFVNF